MEYEKIHLGQKVKAIADENDKSTTWLSPIVGVDERNVRKMFYDEDISLARIRKISKAFGMDLFVLLLSKESRAIYEKGLVLMHPSAEKVEPSVIERVNALEAEVKKMKEEIEELKK